MTFSVDDLIDEGESGSESRAAPPSRRRDGSGPLDTVLRSFAALAGARVHSDGRVSHPCIFHSDKHPSAVLFANGSYFCSVCIATPMPLRAWIESDEARAVLGDDQVQAVLNVSASAERAWEEPEPLPDALLPVPPWSALLLPDSLRPWAADVTERMGCPPEFLAVGVVVALGSVLGRRCAIRPRKHDDFTVIAHPWGAIVAPPGELKSPALHEALRPVRHLEAVARAAHQRDLVEFSFTAAVADAERAKVMAELKKTVSVGENPSILREQLERTNVTAPTLERFMINDCTIEKLGELLEENPNGLLQFRDELIGWFRTLDREGHEADRAFFLEAWSGLSDFVYDRIGRGTRHIPVCCMTVLGGIQAGPLRSYMRSAVRDGVGADGLMQRFQLLVYPDVPRTCGVDRAPDMNAASRVLRIFEAIAALDATSVGASPVHDGVPFLRFTSEAQVTFDEWFAALAHRLRSSEEHPAFVAHLAKYRSLIPALALLFHIADVVDGGAHAGAVPESALGLALQWGEILEAHARRIYGHALDRGGASARLLARKIATGALAGTFTARDVYRRGWVGLTDTDEVQAALAFLEDHDWIRSERENTGGRPRFRYRVNPKSTTDKPDRRRQTGAFVSSGSASTRESKAVEGVGHV